MTNPHTRPVFVGIDGSAAALTAARWAAHEAARRNLDLVLLAAVTAPNGPGRGQERYREVLHRAAWSHLDSAAAEVCFHVPGLQVQRSVEDGTAATVLADASKRAALLVLGRSGHSGFAGLLIGSIALAAAARAHCPVAVVGGSAAARPEAPVVVGVEGSAESDAALGYAFEEANARGVRLVAVHAWSDVVLDPRLMLLLDWVTVEKSAHAFLADRLAGWTGKFPDVDVRTSVVRDRPASALVERSTNAQLLVVGSRGRGGVAGLLLGSVSRAVLPHAHSPVVLVPTGLDAASDSDGGAAG
ncbi:MAG: UspA protein [Pseudonocardia sp.]|jgi:nucleotide-binding universal stress UspA family protein|uniref:universal stress protein n=1 Tax=Pseudonocardia sp. TaxID=60912 RepID=UPI002617A660|nr:universal stress protein [Pseudonocardia sp.]MCU1626669.1 UspA protein [Pseudonocardia sp.]MDT7700133.1 hypothetical protein [Pseudonocardiales bacterium]